MRGAVKSNVQRYNKPDSKFKYLQTSNKRSNLTFWELLISGCFESDWWSYCVNRINGFSCSYWIDYEEFIPFHAIDDNGSISDNKNYCKLVSDEVEELSLNLISKLIVSILIVVSIVLNILTFIKMRKFALVYLPICHYFSYICFFELADCTIMGLDWFISIFSRYKPLLLLQFVKQSSCQMIPMIFSIIRHLSSGLLIGMAIDVWKFIREPVLFLAHYRSEWVKNVFIIFMVLVCTINCQFFWTFDLNKGENKMIHNRLVTNYLECDFSNTLPLNTVFTKFIWPTADHLMAEVLPFLVSLAAAMFSICIIKRRFTCNYPVNLSKVLINATLVLQLTRSLIVYLIVNALVILGPRILYVTIKGFLSESFIQTKFAKLATTHSVLRNNLNSNNNNDFTNTAYKLQPDPFYMVLFGTFIKFQTFSTIVLRFCYFYIDLPAFRFSSVEDFVHFQMSRKANSIKNSLTQEKLLNISSADKDFLMTENPTADEPQRKSLMVEIYC